MLGNLLGLLLIAASVVVATFSFRAGAMTLGVIAYSVFAFFWLGDVGTRPSRSTTFAILLSSAEFESFRKFHTFVRFPAAGQAMSATLNLLRLAGLVWGAWAIWRGEYSLGAVLGLYFFVVGFLCLRFDPFRYMLRAAQGGNDVAQVQLALIQRVVERRELFGAHLSS